MVRLKGIVWKRADFRESSRVVSLWTRDQGRVHALGKGAHRPGSTLLGKVDFLNRLEVDLRGRGLPILARAKLLHEPRALRTPPRFLASNYIVDLFDRVLAADQVDPSAYDLCDGGLLLAERAAERGLATVIAGLELRLLAHLGALPDLLGCSQCGQRFSRTLPPRIPADSGGVFCPPHAPQNATAPPKGTLQALETIRAAAGREWAELERPTAMGSGLGLLARWLSHGLEHVPRSRRATLTFLARQKQHDGSELPSGA